MNENRELLERLDKIGSELESIKYENRNLRKDCTELLETIVKLMKENNEILRRIYQK